ncbi:PHP domain-containing protein [Nakamurella endophytica]|uniref:Polymerase/histidinol phosphatase N-terminal domain-containing protein n=1 Tax=Nakamurella endophytica TaxID=1748367 RepID=A0A917WMS7_9ACTN|nr:PHP domain-containing protein [Nakamurella endophytica]GGM17080.1 hypothetical protein GCM10011594_41440 [Nakamurella endophytica]
MTGERRDSDEIGVGTHGFGTDGLGTDLFGTDALGTDVLGAADAALLRGDHHVHSTFSDDGHSTPEENLAAAAVAGLTDLLMVDHVRVSTTYLPGFVAEVRRLTRPAGLRVRVGVEAKILDAAGTVDAPPEVLAGRAGLDAVLLADHQFPGPDGPASPRVVLERRAAGLAAADIVDTLVLATGRAVHRVPGPQLAHLFSLLPKIGLDETAVTDEHLTALVADLLATGATVEVNEKWACPGPRVVAALRAAGVPLVASTDAHHSRDVGRYDAVRGVLRRSRMSAGRFATERPSVTIAR